MVANIDANVGRLLSQARRLDLERDTIVVFLTDNGPQQRRYNAGMRGLQGQRVSGRHPRAVLRALARDGEAAEPQGRPHRRAHRSAADARSTRAVSRCRAGPQARRQQPDASSSRRTSAWPDRTLFTQWHRGDEPELFRACAARTQQYKLVDGKELYDLAADPAEERNIAAERPEIAARLRQETEAWFRDVSSTRGYAPPRIHLGTSHENPTILTRQDWRGPKASWNEDGLGHWEVEVTRAGRYRIDLRMGTAPSDGEATLAIGTATAHAKIEKGATACSLGELTLDPGPARIQPILRYNQQERGAHYVDVQKL